MTLERPPGTEPPPVGAALPPVRVSVVATVRNERETVAKLVDTLLSQTRVPDEIVVVDGVSTDGTLELLQGYAQAGRIRLVSRPCNIAEGRNLGIAAASGDIIAVTDAGCDVDPRWLEQLVACFAADPALDVAAGNFRFETHTPFEQASVLATFHPNRDETEAARYYPSSRSLAFRKTAWVRAGGYPEWLYAAEDTLFNIRLRQVGCRFVFARDAVVRWRPRTSWAALGKQRFNFARGNGRVGIGSSGYAINLRVHGLALAMAVAGFAWPLLWPLAVALLALHMRRHLWPQAVTATRDRPWTMRWRVLGVMEFVRLVSMAGYLRGRWERFADPSFVANQQRYMNVRSVEELEAQGLV